MQHYARIDVRATKSDDNSKAYKQYLALFIIWIWKEWMSADALGDRGKKINETPFDNSALWVLILLVLNVC